MITISKLFGSSKVVIQLTSNYCLADKEEGLTKSAYRLEEYRQGNSRTGCYIKTYSVTYLLDLPLAFLWCRCCCDGQLLVRSDTPCSDEQWVYSFLPPNFSDSVSRCPHKTTAWKRNLYCRGQTSANRLVNQWTKALTSCPSERRKMKDELDFLSLKFPQNCESTYRRRGYIHMSGGKGILCTWQSVACCTWPGRTVPSEVRPVDVISSRSLCSRQSGIFFLSFFFFFKGDRNRKPRAGERQAYGRKGQRKDMAESEDTQTVLDNYIWSDIETCMIIEAKITSWWA